MFEGVKETEHTRIEKDSSSESEIDMLYSFGVVIFEHCVLCNDSYEYSICYFAPRDIYDIVIINKKEGHIEYFETTHQLNDTYLSYFNLINGESVLDNDGNKLVCRSHSVEYTL